MQCETLFEAPSATLPGRREGTLSSWGESVRKTLEANKLRFDGRSDLAHVINYIEDVEGILSHLGVREGREAEEAFKRALSEQTGKSTRKLFKLISVKPARLASHYRTQANVINDLAKRLKH